MQYRYTIFSNALRVSSTETRLSVRLLSVDTDSHESLEVGVVDATIEPRPLADPCAAGVMGKDPLPSCNNYIITSTYNRVWPVTLVMSMCLEDIFIPFNPHFNSLLAQGSSHV